MEQYKNLSGISGVSSFEIGTDSIIVQFRTGSIYLYNYESTGINDIEQMKRLAHEGIGLNSFIGRVVKKRFAKKIR